MRHKIIEIIEAIDQQLVINHITIELIKMGFDNYNDGCFVWRGNFKVVFSVDNLGKKSLPMQIIYKPLVNGERGAERKNQDFMDIYTISQIREAHSILMGEPI